MVNPTLAIIEISICSFWLNLPGLRLYRTPKSVKPISGRNLSAALPIGKASNWTTVVPRDMLGWRTMNSWLTKATRTTKPIPMTHARIVLTGIAGSSYASTTARTSA